MDYTGSTAWNGRAPDPEKSSRLLIRDYPHRAIAIATESHALIFRHSASGGNYGVSNGNGDTLKCMVAFTPVNKDTLSEYRTLTPRPIYGTLGLIAVGQDIFLSVITQALRVSTLRPGETVEMIQQVQFFCLNSNKFDEVLSLAIDHWDVDSDAASMHEQQQGGLSRREVPVEHPCQELMKLLGNRSFYYSTDFDLTNRLQDRSADSSSFDIDNFDESFLWNSFMIQPLVQFRARLQRHEREILDSSRILTSAVRGFCLTVTIPQSVAPLRTGPSGMPSYLTVISRLSCKRAGTRFNSRGIDDDGHVANFVETETIYWSPSGVLFSYVQVRGSVPVFWEQSPGLLPGHQKIIVTRSPDGAQPAFDKHFENLEQSYGAIHVVNLLSEAKPGEAELTQCYRYGIKHSPLSHKGATTDDDHSLIRCTEYDFHAETRGPTGYEAAQEIRRYIENSADGFAYYLAMETDDDNPQKQKGGGSRRSVVALQQEGVFRTNCLDCLDRTNLIQTIISQMAVEAFLSQRGEYAGPDFWVRHSNLWADNGDALSKIYAGTGALKSSFTRSGKMSLAGAIADARKSATRLYINNFADKGRQNTIDMLLGRLYGQMPVVLFDPISDYVTAELNKRAGSFSSTEAITLWVGTLNLNGRLDGLGEDISPWLFPTPPETADQLPELFAVGFQEIVELSPQQIMNSDPSRKQKWEAVVRNTLNDHAAAVGGEPYVLLRSGQLVGAALCIFVRSSALGKIKNVEGSVKKTGMSGMAGNKGAVAIRLDYASTPLCFVTAHLAAGFSNYEERNRDYMTIHHGLRFQRNRGIDDHDAVLWFGDFNYRIGLGRDRAMDLVRAGNIEALYENDQLNLQMVAGLAFPYYSEARITFPPTYKFDVGCDEYDSSEKQRIPAWTDRILRKGAPLRQLEYKSAPLRFSDHRPVYAYYVCTVNMTDEAARDKISHELYERRKAELYERRKAEIDDMPGSSSNSRRNNNSNSRNNNNNNNSNNNIIDDTDEEDLLGYDAIEPGLPAASSDRQKWWLKNGQMAQAAVQPPVPANPAHMAVLNPKRPANPFTPTDEADWVAVPRAESRLSSFSSLSTSPYEHVNLSSSANSQSVAGSFPRKAIGSAPHDKSGQGMARSASSSGGGGGGGGGVPPPPPPRRQQTASSNLSGGAAADDKPAKLAGGPTTQAAYNNTVSAVTKAFDELRRSGSGSSSPATTTTPPVLIKAGGGIPPPLPARNTPATLPTTTTTTTSTLPIRPLSAASNTSAATKGKLAPPIAKKPAHLAGVISPLSDYGDHSDHSAPPPPKPQRRQTDLLYSDKPPKLPARTPTLPPYSDYAGARPIPAKARNQDLLGDDGDSELSRWQALQPS